MNILLVSLDQAKLYPPIIQKYIESQGVPCFLSKWRKTDIEKILKENHLNPTNTIIHARLAGLDVNETFKELESKGFRVINSSESLELTSNKFFTYKAAVKNNIPTPETVEVNKKDINLILKSLEDFKVAVLKPVYSQGMGKFCKKIEVGISAKEIETEVEDIPGNTINIQQYVDYAKLIRLIVIGGKALKEATTYDEPTESWKTSVCMNPNVKKYNFENQELFNLAEKVAKDFNLEITFIDFFEDQTGKIILNEINTACAFIIQEDITGVKIHEYIGDYLIQEAKKKLK